MRNFAEEARRKDSTQRHFHVQKLLWWSSCCLQEKAQWPSVNAQNLVLSSLSCLQLKCYNGKSSFLTKFIQGCCHDDHCDLPSLPVHLGCQVSTCISCYSLKIYEIRFMGIDYYFVRAQYDWPEVAENPTYPVTWLSQFYTIIDIPQVMKRQLAGMNFIL